MDFDDDHPIPRVLTSMRKEAAAMTFVVSSPRRYDAYVEQVLRRLPAGN
ncbi:hypothetical protein AB0L63_04990 [Nocardia sp. NPDC051990]